VDDAILRINEPYNPATGFPTDESFVETFNRAGISYVQPSAALVFDNSLFGYVGPFYGRRYRFELAQNLGGWTFTQFTADFRRYDRIVGPVVLATRILAFGRTGPDAREFKLYAGSTELVRGHTSGSFRRNECLNANEAGTETGCAALDRLNGTQLAVGNLEIRFPLLNQSFGIPAGIPPLEGVLFYDIGLTWDPNSTIVWRREPGDDPVNVRAPFKALGFGVRTNLFGFTVLRLDYAIPQDRRDVGGLWTFSLGPAF
jgi:outer membrane protein assembly factor BamA